MIFHDSGEILPQRGSIVARKDVARADRIKIKCKKITIEIAAKRSADPIRTRDMIGLGFLPTYAAHRRKLLNPSFVTGKGQEWSQGFPLDTELCQNPIPVPEIHSNNMLGSRLGNKSRLSSFVAFSQPLISFSASWPPACAA